MTADVMECACGDLRELSQMYLRCTGGGDQVMHFEVACIDCTITEGHDTDQMLTLAELLDAAADRDRLSAAAQTAYALTSAIVASPFWDQGAKQCALPVNDALSAALRRETP